MKLHLFNEVFIDYHTEMHIPQGSKVIIFSDTYNTDMDTNPNCVSCHDTLDARLDGDTIQDFFTDTIALTGQHIIYANEDDFARIVASWLRSTTNMTADEFGVWLGIYKYNCKTNARRHDILYPAMQNAFADAPVYDLSSVDFNPSFEFLLASAFYNINFSKKSKLVSILTGFIKREYEDFVLDVRRNIDGLILDSALQTQLGASSFNENIDLDNITTQFSGLSVFRAPYWSDDVTIPSQSTAYHPGDFAGGLTKLDLSLASEAELNALLQFTQDYMWVLAGGGDASDQISDELMGKIFGPRGFAYKSCILSNTLTDEQYASAVNEIINESKGLVFMPPQLVDSVLVPLIPFFRSLKTLDLDKLQKYTLK